MQFWKIIFDGRSGGFRRFHDSTPIDKPGGIRLSSEKVNQTDD
jgi:hypothetical protein